MANNFSFNLPEGRKLTGFNVVAVAAETMRSDPYFLHKRKDGKLYKRGGPASQWIFWGSPMTILSAFTNHWALIITPAGQRCFDVQTFKHDVVGRAAFPNFCAIQKRAAA